MVDGELWYVALECLRLRLQQFFLRTIFARFG